MNQIRGNSSSRGYDSKWNKFSKEFLKEFPFCSVCGNHATITGHTEEANKFFKENGFNLLEFSLYVPRCRSCNRLDKTRLNI